MLVPRTTLEIRDMDSCTTLEEVELALRKKLQNYEGKLEVRLTKPNAAGQRMAVFSIEEEAHSATGVAAGSIRWLTAKPAPSASCAQVVQ